MTNHPRENIEATALFIISIFHYITNILPELMAWVSFIYLMMRVYVFYRDELTKRKNKCE